jgi:hypothetical protein
MDQVIKDEAIQGLEVRQKVDGSVKWLCFLDRTPKFDWYVVHGALEEIVSKSTLLCGDCTQENA